jgi:hypothetical protein
MVVPPNLQPFIGSSCPIYRLYNPKKNANGQLQCIDMAIRDHQAL